MKIQDLSKDLGAKAMSAVRGGDNGNSVNNTIGQVQNIYAPVAVAGYGPTNSTVHVSGTQNASICNSQYGGDFFAALFPGLPVIAG